MSSLASTAGMCLTIYADAVPRCGYFEWLAYLAIQPGIGHSHSGAVLYDEPQENLESAYWCVDCPKRLP